jgi:hypothetical protein
MLIVPELFGRVTLLDGQDRLICSFGVNDSVRDEWPWPNETKLVPGLFNSPHGATADPAGNIFVLEGGWAGGSSSWKNSADRDCKVGLVIA